MRNVIRPNCSVARSPVHCCCLWTYRRMEGKYNRPSSKTSLLPVFGLDEALPKSVIGKGNRDKHILWYARSGTTGLMVVLMGTNSSALSLFPLSASMSISRIDCDPILWCRLIPNLPQLTEEAAHVSLSKLPPCCIL